jgi:putative nucleotidyltransferase with HDIG domain
MTTDKIVAILLAAGYSSRMQDFKPLLPLGEVTVIERLINTYRDAGVSDIRVVIGHNAELLQPILALQPVKVIFNENYPTGMYSSVMAGVSSLEADAEAFFLHPADIPMVKARTIKRLIQGYKNYIERAKGIIFPCYKGARGHPPLIPAYLKEEILHWQGTEGLRGLISMLSPHSLDLAVPDEAVLLDMDTPKDYQYLLQHIKRRQAPTSQECMEILAKLYVSSQIVKHCQAVTAVATQITCALNEVGCHLDLELIIAAALLHDMTKGTREHAKTGAQIVRQYGYDEVAEIIEYHMDIDSTNNDEITEAHVLYLADKLVKEEQVVTLDERLSKSRTRFAHSPEILNKVVTRLDKAQNIKKNMEKILGYSIGQHWLERKIIQNKD